MTTAKKAAAPAKKAAASAPAKDDAQTTESPTPTEAAPLDAPAADPVNDADAEKSSDGSGDAAEDGSTVARSNAVETGPQTGVAAPAENTARPPATIGNETPGASPLDPPADQHTQRQPELGHPTSSTDHTYAEVGGQTIAGENLVRLVDSRGEAIDVETLFHRESDRATHVISTKRVFEEFTYPGASTVTKRLIFAEGARVPLAQASRIEAAAKADIEAAASASE